MKNRSILALIAVAGLSACATQGGSSMAPFSQAGLPDAVQVPAGHNVAMQTMASGDITYQCRVKKDMAGQFEWVFVGPDAGLNDRRGKRVGKYYGPPATWESLDGSRVSGAQVAVAPAGAGRIPLQLVKANPAMGMGAMQGVSYIQRVNTQGGVAPASPCDVATLDQKQTVKYTADYIFWRAL
ncbi:DUF3455 domain-containing protein [Rhodoferax ferrireducens]|uniref:DUF3455 domain-containing protein n=1 Tax=Rhodoferax ferrireducens TaxID=192843 RepID=UPI000E0DD27C|nr:DUF3455 domain-containing protein [Rhodoferax ferrireducens]